MPVIQSPIFFWLGLIIMLVSLIIIIVVAALVIASARKSRIHRNPNNHFIGFLTGFIVAQIFFNIGVMFWLGYITALLP